MWNLPRTQFLYVLVFLPNFRLKGTYLHIGWGWGGGEEDLQVVQVAIEIRTWYEARLEYHGLVNTEYI